MRTIPKQEIYRALSEVQGTVGLYIHALESDEVFSLNPEHVFPSASVIKIPMLALLLQDVADGKQDWEAPCPISAENRVGGTGILSELDESYVPTLKNLAKLMIVLSDNSATNQIMDLIQIDRFNAFCDEMGMPNTKLSRKMMDFESIRQGRNNYMCAGEAGKLLVQIARGEFVSPEVSKTILSIMEKQQCRNKLPSLIPAVDFDASQEEKDNMEEGTVLVANKTGDLYTIQHDVGVFTLPDGRRYVISAFTGDLNVALDGIGLIAKISKIMYDAMK